MSRDTVCRPESAAELFASQLCDAMRASDLGAHKQADLLHHLADGQHAMAMRFVEMEAGALSRAHFERALALRNAATDVLLEAHRAQFA